MKWVSLLVIFSSLFTSHLFSDEIINAGRGGNSTVNLLKRVESDVIAKKPSLVVIMVGTNDMLNSAKLLTPDQYKENLQNLISQITDANADIVLVTPPTCIESYLYTRHDPSAYGELSPDKRLEIARGIVLELAKVNKLIAIDFHKHLSENNLVHEGKDSIMRNVANSGKTDGVHPTAEGYQILAGLVAKQIADQKLNTERVICFGDSITYGAAMKGAGTATGATYPGQLAKILSITQ